MTESDPPQDCELFTPTGVPIKGTLENVRGVAILYGALRGPDGSLDLRGQYEGTTEMDWDSNETVTRDGQRIFVDEEGHEWPENELVIKPT